MRSWHVPHTSPSGRKESGTHVCLAAVLSRGFALARTRARRVLHTFQARLARVSDAFECYLEVELYCSWMDLPNIIFSTYVLLCFEVELSSSTVKRRCLFVVNTIQKCKEKNNKQASLYAHFTLAY